MDNHGQFSQLQNSYGGVSIEKGGVDRVPQWNIEETQNFLVIRAELDPTFMETKRNKLLWELVSARMNEIGYNRSPVQCKCKWKNLVTRYKGCETIQELEMRQWTFPFYNEMQIIFNARLQRLMWVEEEGGGGAGGAASSSQKSPAAEQFPSNYEDANKRENGREKKKKKRKEKAAANTGGDASGSSPLVDGLKGIMEEFMNQQMEMEMQWIKAYEEREERRREREVEWRQRMETMENERLMMMRWWREREEQRKMREEARAERRDALVTTLLNKIRRENM